MDFVDETTCFNCKNYQNGKCITHKKHTKKTDTCPLFDKSEIKIISKKKNNPVEKQSTIEKELIANEKGFMFSDFNMFTNYLAMATQFRKKHPFYYDTNKIFWFWNDTEKKWEKVDETDLLNAIDNHTEKPTTNSKVKYDILEALKRIGRRNKPKEIQKTWVQFKDKIYDVKTGEIIIVSSNYFVTTPLPWNVGKSEDTPTIDKLFTEWVGENYVKTLYELIAYTMGQNKFMQRIIGLCGGGSNGKGTYIKLLYRFLGEDNCVASEIKSLSEDKFEPAVLHKKLLCVMGEVSYSDLKNTNQLKKLGGEDKISFQFKGKTPFTDDNTATCICLTNSMPVTPDKSIGFYRKWLLIDFPNQFKQLKEDLIYNIPDEEFDNLACKCLRILKELYINPEFTNEGTFEDRAQRYEERSNPVISYISEFCEEIAGENISLREFTNSCNEYLKTKHLRIMTANHIGKVLRDEGFQVGARRINDISAVVILNLVKKGIKTTNTIIGSISFPIGETSKKYDSLNSFIGISTGNEGIPDGRLQVEEEIVKNDNLVA